MQTICKQFGAALVSEGVRYGRPFEAISILNFFVLILMAKWRRVIWVAEKTLVCEKSWNGLINFFNLKAAFAELERISSNRRCPRSFKLRVTGRQISMNSFGSESFKWNYVLELVFDWKSGLSQINRWPPSMEGHRHAAKVIDISPKSSQFNVFSSCWRRRIGTSNLGHSQKDWPFSFFPLSGELITRKLVWRFGCALLKHPERVQRIEEN